MSSDNDIENERRSVRKNFDSLPCCRLHVVMSLLVGTFSFVTSCFLVDLKLQHIHSICNICERLPV